MKIENVIVAVLSIAVISIPVAEAKDLPTSINQPRIIAQDSEIPTEAKNHLNSGVYRYRAGDYEGAIKEYTQAIRIKPDYAKAYTNRGAARAELKDFSGAIKDHTQAIWLAPRDATAYNNRGIVRVEMKDFKAAIEDYTSAIKLEPDHARAYVNRGLARKASGDLKGAIADLKKGDKLLLEQGVISHHQSIQVEIEKLRGVLAEQQR